jgi:acyl-CoA thioesterase FadM
MKLNLYICFAGISFSPWSLLSLFESARLVTQSNPESKSDHDNKQSLADSYHLLQNYNFYTATVEMEVHPSLYNIELPKHPLVATTKFDYAGKSSFAIHTSIQHPSLDVPYATCAIQSVLVDRQTARPTPFPEWWREKFGDVCVGGKPHIMPKLIKPPSVVPDVPVTVQFRDTDTYNHSNWKSYSRFCYDAVSMNAIDSRYRSLTQADLVCGVKKLVMSYRQESVVGDILNVASWEDEENEGEINCDITKDGATCCQTKIQFFSANKINSLL